MKTQLLSACIASVETPEGWQRLNDYLTGRPFPHFTAHPTRTYLLIRSEQDGTQTLGSFVRRTWVVVPNEAGTDR